jgi:hypothetical protein
VKALRKNDTVLIKELFKNLNTHKLSLNVTKIFNDSLVWNVIDILKLIESLVLNYTLNKFKVR